MQMGILSTGEQIASAAPGWDDLETYLGGPCSRHAWTQACAEHLACDGRLAVVVARQDKTVVATAPLTRPRRALRWLQLGVHDHGETTDFSYRDAEALDTLARGLAVRRFALSLLRLPGDSPVAAALQRAYAHRALVVITPQPDCPFIEVHGTEDEATKRLSSRLRSDLRRGNRKAEAFGPVSFDVSAPSSWAELQPLWHEALEVEGASWKGRRGSALRLDRRLEAFYRDYALRACEIGALRLMFLRLDEEAAAAMIALVTGDRLWILKIGYDERFAACSPGMLLLHEGLRYAAREGLASYEFMGAESGWTHRWTDEGRPTVAVRVYPYTIAGAFLLARDSAVHAWAKMRKRGGTD